MLSSKDDVQQTGSGVASTSEALQLGPGGIRSVGPFVHVHCGEVNTPQGPSLGMLCLRTGSPKDAEHVAQILRSVPQFPVLTRDAVLSWLQERIPEFQDLLVPAKNRHDDEGE